MSDLPHDPSNELFAQQLRQLVPAKASAVETSNGPLTVETLLYQAGYEAAREQWKVADKVQTSHRSQGSRSQGPSRRSPARWMPIVAASLMTAVLTLPIAYRLGHESTGVLVDTIAERDDSSVSLSDPPIVRPAEQLRAGDRRSIPKRSIDSIPVLNLAQVLQPEWKLPGRPSGTLTAFTTQSLESIPRSDWIAMEDESKFPRETLSTGDLDEFALGLQVNQR